MPGSVEETVGQVRDQVDQIPLPPALKQPVQPVLDTVQQVGRTVDGVTLPPTLP